MNLKERTMQNSEIIAIAVTVVVLAVVAALIYSQRRTRHLREHFGPEYDRAITETGGRRQAEAELAHREDRIRKLEIKPLSASDRERFSHQWTFCQAQFVDDPSGAVDTADRLLTDVIRARGYAADNPHDRIADLTAAYPQHVTHYRAADEIVTRHREGDATTEDLRKAFVHYRNLFEEILGGKDEERKRAS
jgi:hypothetical protein